MTREQAILELKKADQQLVAIQQGYTNLEQDEVDGEYIHHIDTCVRNLREALIYLGN